MAKFSQHSVRGITLIELLVGLAIVSILISIASPAMGRFVASMRVDSEISTLHRLLLQARNQAINSGQNVTLCPLDSDNTCTNNWTNELSLFTNDNRNTVFETDQGEVMIQKRDALDSGDKLVFPFNSVTYTPEGRAANGTFSYCPLNYEDELSRALIISLSGRVYQSSDIDNDGVEEDSSGDVSCD